VFAFRIDDDVRVSAAAIDKPRIAASGAAAPERDRAEAVRLGTRILVALSWLAVGHGISVARRGTRRSLRKVATSRHAGRRACMTRTHAAILADLGLLDLDAPPPTRRETPDARRELEEAATEAEERTE
jgi:hypothetical protein